MLVVFQLCHFVGYTSTCCSNQWKFCWFIFLTKLLLCGWIDRCGEQRIGFCGGIVFDRFFCLLGYYYVDGFSIHHNGVLATDLSHEFIGASLCHLACGNSWDRRVRPTTALQEVAKVFCCATCSYFCIDFSDEAMIEIYQYKHTFWSQSGQKWFFEGVVIVTVFLKLAPSYGLGCFVARIFSCSIKNVYIEFVNKIISLPFCPVQGYRIFCRGGHSLRLLQYSIV